MGAPQATESTEQEKKPSGEIQVPDLGPPHVCYKGENQDLPKMVGTLIFTFKLRSHRERWPWYHFVLEKIF